MEIHWIKTVGIMRELIQEFDDVYLDIYKYTRWNSEKHKDEDQGHSWLIYILFHPGDVDLTEWQEEHLSKIREIANEYGLRVKMSSFQDEFAVMLHEANDDD